MKGSHILAGAGAIALAIAAAAQAQWAGGWGYGNGSMGSFGRTEGPVSVDLWPNGESTTVSVTVTGCGGVRDFRSFGTDVAVGEGQTADAAAAVTRLLGEARRACNFEPRLAERIEQGFAPAFDAWLVEMASMDMNMNMADMNATVDMNAYEAAENALDAAADAVEAAADAAECNAEDCNGM